MHSLLNVALGDDEAGCRLGSVRSGRICLGEGMGRTLEVGRELGPADDEARGEGMIRSGVRLAARPSGAASMGAAWHDLDI